MNASAWRQYRCAKVRTATHSSQQPQDKRLRSSQPAGAQAPPLSNGWQAAHKTGAVLGCAGRFWVRWERTQAKAVEGADAPGASGGKPQSACRHAPGRPRLPLATPCSHCCIRACARLAAQRLPARSGG